MAKAQKTKERTRERKNKRKIERKERERQTAKLWKRIHRIIDISMNKTTFTGNDNNINDLKKQKGEMFTLQIYILHARKIEHARLRLHGNRANESNSTK